MTEEPLTAGGRLTELAALFLRLGILGFGGPAAHIAMMRDEVVRRRRWMTDQAWRRYFELSLGSPPTAASQGTK